MPDDNERRHHSLTREDLAVLLESYKNMVESNLQVMDKQLTAINKINTLYEMFQTLSNSVNNSFKEIYDRQITCAAGQREYNDDLKGILKTDHTENQTTHLKQGFKLYGLISLFATIILGLIGLIYRLWPSGNTPLH